MELAIDASFRKKCRHHITSVVYPGLLVVDPRKLGHRVGVVLLRARVRVCEECVDPVDPGQPEHPWGSLFKPIEFRGPPLATDVLQAFGYLS